MAERPATILMVVDEPQNLDLLEALLQPQGYRQAAPGSTFFFTLPLASGDPPAA